MYTYVFEYVSVSVIVNRIVSPFPCLLINRRIKEQEGKNQRKFICLLFGGMETVFRLAPTTINNNLTSNYLADMSLSAYYPFYG